MATPQPTATQGQLDESSSRLVWVLNRDAKPYKGKFEGAPVEIPANSEKIAKLHHKGGNLMPYLAARSFITDYKEPQEWVMDAGGKPQPIFGPKALYDMELTQDEFDKIVKKSSAQLSKETAAEEKKARKTLVKELDKRSNKVAVDDEDL